MPFALIGPHSETQNTGMTSPSRRPDRALTHAGKQRENVDSHGLRLRERLFVEAYVLNGGNATRAYLAAAGHVKETTAAVEGWKLLRLPKVQHAIETRRAERFKALQMEGDEALALIAMRARANLAEAFDDTGKLLPFHLWPESLQLAVRWRINENGHLEVQHADGLKAAELMAIAAGRLKNNLLHVQFDHASYLAGLDEPPVERGPDAD